MRNPHEAGMQTDHPTRRFLIKSGLRLAAAALAGGAYYDLHQNPPPVPNHGSRRQGAQAIVFILAGGLATASIPDWYKPINQNSKTTESPAEK